MCVCLCQISKHFCIIIICVGKAGVKLQPHRMAKHTQTIRRQIADELLKCF